MLIHGLQRGLLLLAGLLLSLHSVIPHVHGSHPDVAERQAAAPLPSGGDNLLTLLQGLLTDSDLGEDHLEHFSADHDATPALALTAGLPPAALPSLVITFPVLPPPPRRQQVYRSRMIPPSGVYPDTAAPRGPPSFV